MPVVSDGQEIWRYRRWVVVVGAVVVVMVFVVAMLLLRPDPGGAVLWENYPPDPQQQIEETGVGNETLIRYLDDELGAAGCPPA